MNIKDLWEESRGSLIAGIVVLYHRKKKPLLWLPRHLNL